MRLPDWLDPLYDSEEMRACDAWATRERGVPSLDLMERAGNGLARVVAARAGPAPIRMVIGKGNNGGDGLVAVRHLRAEGREVELLAIAPPGELQGDPAENLARLPGERPRQFAPDALTGSGAVVDALLGTGFEGAPREPAACAIRAMRELEGIVIACDVPSGVNAATGEIEGEAVRAQATATFHGPKIGLHVAPGAFHSGTVETIDIGIPRGAPGPEAAGLITARALAGVPHREREGSKFTSGVVLVAGGAAGMTGAPAMAALSAQRAGAGYVQLAVP
ncbi:MAG: NAD(P)H-hydrate epimerase, partial [Thermoleophilaceae bacterium]|nr:NAD(P)H-hydrate epimerase [Thermoleophilaceae bacterium]